MNLGGMRAVLDVAEMVAWASVAIQVGLLVVWARSRDELPKARFVTESRGK